MAVSLRREGGKAMATPKKEKPAETPGYWPTTKIAELFELTARRIQQLTQDGVLKTHETPAGRRYNVAEATKDYLRYMRRQLEQKQSAQNNKLETDKLQAEVDIKNAKARVAELQLAELEGTMHRAEDVEAMTTDLVFSIRSALMAMPGRLAVDTAELTSPAETSVRIQEEVNEILRSLSQYQYDPEEYKKRVKDRQGWAIIEDDEQTE